MSLRWAPSSGNPREFGALLGSQWPSLAVRRYMTDRGFVIGTVKPATGVAFSTVKVVTD